MDTVALVLDAFSELGLDATSAHGATDGAIDVVLEPDGGQVEIQLKRRALVTIDDAERLLREAHATGRTVLVVADRVTVAARNALVSGRAGYLDLRGHVALRADRFVIASDIVPRTGKAQRSEALAGRAGLEVATILLMRPSRSVSGREVAREIGRSPSTVSVILSALRDNEMIDENNAVVGPNLFWAVSDRWPTRRTYLSQLPTPGDASLTLALRLGFRDVENEPGWALTDSAAAAAYGAPLAFRSDQSLDFFVPDEHTVRRAVKLLGEVRTASQAAATLRAAPVSTIVRHRVLLPTNPSEWPLAHPLFVALDLARDLGRGREILDSWMPTNGWSRVW